MTAIQIADETFVAASPVLVKPHLGSGRTWQAWWPELTVSVTEDRGDLGVRFTIAGEVAGTMEFWLQPVMDGTVMHYFLHGAPTAASLQTSPGAAAEHVRTKYRVLGRRIAFAVKLAAEEGRLVGSPATTSSRLRN